MFSLAKNGIVGLNKRNLDYIFQYNQRRHYENADSKLATKLLAESAGVKTPKLLGHITGQRAVQDIASLIRKHGSGVVKPDHGSGGGGILVVQDVLPIGFRKSSGEVMNQHELQFHCQNILSGMFSLGGLSDQILVESLVAFDPVFDDIAFRGVPDVRIIVLQGKVMMAMLRLPTKQSDGKANLHMGGLGVGIDINTGLTTHAVQFNSYIERHPETGALLAGRTIPHWQDMLDIAVTMQQVSKLGYVGVDIVLDLNEGPMVLEINARPGISIQIANGRGLMA